MIRRDRALALLAQCTGDDIWSRDHCRLAGVPEAWIDELSDTFESGFRADYQTIYVENQVANHYHGVRDVDLAMKLGESLGLDVSRYARVALGRRELVAAIKQGLMDGD